MSKKYFDYLKKIKGDFYPYPNSEWTTPSDVPVGIRVIDGGVVKISSQCFLNDGADFFDCGRPAFISSLNQNTNNYTVRCVFKKNPILNAIVFGIRGADLGQLVLFQGVGSVAYRYGVRIGGSTLEFDHNAEEEYIDIVVKVNSLNMYVFSNSVFIGSFACGAILSTANLFIGSRFDGTLNNQGITTKISFYSGVGDTSNCSVDGLTLLDKYDFTNKAQWDGGPTMISQMGNIATLTDGIPSTAYSKDLIPLEFL